MTEFTDEQVERAARAAFEFDQSVAEMFGKGSPLQFDDLPEWARKTHMDRARAALAAAGVAPQETERVNGLDVHDWAKIARAKDEANEVAVAAIEDLAHAIRLTVEYVGNDWLPPAEGWSWFDALMKHRPELAQPFVESPILLRPQGEPAGIVSPALSETAQRIKREWLATHEGFEDLYSAEFDRMLAGVAPPAPSADRENLIGDIRSVRNWAIAEVDELWNGAAFERVLEAARQHALAAPSPVDEVKLAEVLAEHMEEVSEGGVRYGCECGADFEGTHSEHQAHVVREYLEQR